MVSVSVEYLLVDSLKYNEIKVKKKRRKIDYITAFPEKAGSGDRKYSFLVLRLR